MSDELLLVIATYAAAIAIVAAPAPVVQAFFERWWSLVMAPFERAARAVRRR